ncbi:MAG TPA: SPW repeat protein [Stellaceae bacterium]|nr:SPW repeat protein [Stellaceae bacterium]
MPTYLRDPNRRNRWQDWVNALLAIWLFISPWVLQFGQGGRTAAPGAGAAGGPIDVVGNAAWNAWVLGVIVFLIALSAIGKLAFWQEWINLLLGAWLFASPWALGFLQAAPAASWDHWIVGFLVFILSIWSLTRMQSVPTVRGDYAHAADRPRRDDGL